MNIVKEYSLEEVEAILKFSERNIPPGRAYPGHTISRHVNISNAEMIRKEYQDYLTRFNRENTRKLALFTWATAFANQADAVTTAHFLLNCPEGQRNLSHLQGDIGAVRDWWSNQCPEIKIRFSSGDVVRTTTTTAAAIVVIPISRYHIHIHTCFPILGDEPQAGLARNL
jgi:hypothetical protein